jgi:hypothetical protein
MDPGSGGYITACWYHKKFAVCIRTQNIQSSTLSGHDMQHVASNVSYRRRRRQASRFDPWATNQ